MVHTSVLFGVLSGNQVKHDKHYKGHPSTNGCMESIEILLLIKSITDMSVHKVT